MPADVYNTTDKVTEVVQVGDIPDNMWILPRNAHTLLNDIEQVELIVEKNTPLVVQEYHDTEPHIISQYKSKPKDALYNNVKKNLMEETLQSLRYLTLCLGPTKTPRKESYAYRLKHDAESCTIDGHQCYVSAYAFAHAAENCGAPLKWHDRRYGYCNAYIGLIPPRPCGVQLNRYNNGGCHRVIQSLQKYRCGKCGITGYDDDGDGRSDVRGYTLCTLSKFPP